MMEFLKSSRRKATRSDFAYLLPPAQIFSVDNVASWSYIVIMKSVGLRELKNRLSEYVREVRSGEGVLVTDRGEVVAELLPPGQGLDERGVPSGLMALAKRGQLTLGASNEATLYPKLTPLLKRHRAAALLDEERGTR
jgi:prevent-host-death family protein